MNYNDVKKAAKALINYNGPEARLNDLTNMVKQSLLAAHSWEKFMQTQDVSYTGGESYVELNTNDYRHLFRVVAVRVSGVDLAPPEYVTPGEYNRLLAASADQGSYIRYWTQIGTKLYVLGEPSASRTLSIIAMRSPENVGWGEIGAEFFDLAVTILARLLTPIGTVGADGRAYRNPQYVALVEMEREHVHTMIQLEYRQPGRNYKVMPDELRTLRNESWDY